MSKFETFLRKVLIVIFKETPFNKQKADESFEKIKATHFDNFREDNNEFSK